jgi:hypothetical protein
VDRLPDPEQVPLAVAEPAGALALASLARLVAGDLRDPVHGPQPRQVDLLELNAALTQLGHGGLDVVHLPPIWVKVPGEAPADSNRPNSPFAQR